MVGNIIFKSKVVIRRIIYIFLNLVDLSLQRKPEIFILCYHGISNDKWRYSVNSETFKKQIDYLLKKYEPLTLSDVELVVQGKKKLNKPSFVITIDDGYKDVLKIRNFLNKAGVKPTLFVLSKNQKADRLELDTNRNFLSKDDILNLKKDGWIIASHGATHKDFYNLNEEEIKDEVIVSKKDLEKTFGVKIKYFAYPKGRYTNKVLKAVKKAGYSLGLSMNDGFIKADIDSLLVPRVGVDRTHSFLEFKSIYMPSSIRFRKFFKERIGILI